MELDLLDGNSFEFGSSYYLTVVILSRCVAQRKMSGQLAFFKNVPKDSRNSVIKNYAFMKIMHLCYRVARAVFLCKNSAFGVKK